MTSSTSNYHDPQPKRHPSKLESLGDSEPFRSEVARLAGLAPEPFATRLWLLGHGWFESEGRRAA